MAQPQQQQNRPIPIQHLTTKWPEVEVIMIGGSYVAIEKGKEITLWPPHQDESLDEWVNGLSNRQVEALRIIHYEKWCLNTGNASDKEIWQICENEKEFRMPAA